MPLKKKIIKTTKAKSRTYDTKYLGDEPDVSKMPSDSERALFKLKVFNWYNYFLSAKDLRDDVLLYVSNNEASRLPNFSYYDDYSMSISAAKLCRMINRGWIPNEHEITYIKESLDKCRLDIPIEKTEEVKKSVVIRPKPNPLVQEMDLVEDKWTREEDYEEYDLYERLQALMPSETDRAELKEWLEGRLSEFTTHKSDYKGYNCPRIAKYLRRCLSDLDRSASNKKQRRSRKVKVKSADKIVSRVKFLPSSSEYKLESVNPEKLVGARGVFLFNTGNRELQYYEGDSITVKGTTLVDWNVCRRTTLRKPDEFLKVVLDRTRMTILKEWDKLSTKTYKENMSGRVSDKHVIVRVFNN